MQVTWVTVGGLRRTSDGAPTSDVASMRYRVITPVLQLNRPPYRHRILAAGPDAPEADLEPALQADVLVFSKSVRPQNEALARRAKAAGAKVIFDICDNHYAHPQLGAHFQSMTTLADKVVCNTEAMADVARHHGAIDPVVIPDPCEGPRGEPGFSPGEPLKLLWFGHPLNLESLQAAMPELLAHAQDHRLSLTVLTKPNPQLLKAAEAISRQRAGVLTMAVEPWSLDAQWRALADCDAVIIPTLESERHMVKSANRLVEALWAGKPVAAQPLPAYEAFSRWTPVRPTIAEGLKWLQEHAAQIPALLTAAQAHIAETFDPERIALQWEAVIRAQRAGKDAA